MGSKHHIQELTQLLVDSARKENSRKIGIEIERIGMWPDCTPFGYKNTYSAEGEERPGAEELLRSLSNKYKWPLKFNPEGLPLGLTPETGNISLEPGSQLELSTEASVQLNSLVEKADQFEAMVDKVTAPWGLSWIGLGVNPCNRVEDIDVIPSKRYRIMTDYLGRHPLGTSMMRLSSSIQINLDYRSESEGIDMLRAGLAATPLSYALFANSPIKRGSEVGAMSFRYEIWQKTDPDRTGLFHQAFEKDYNFGKYIEFLWHYPLMFAQDTSGNYVAAEGASLEDISKGKLPNVEVDENNRLTCIRQLFTEARIKPGYVEVRSVDGQRPQDRYAAAAFWMGILYDEQARALVNERLGKLTVEDKEALTVDCAKRGLQAELKGKPILSLCKEIVEASKKGLEARGFGEESYLTPIFQSLEDGMCPAARVLEKFHSVDTKKN